MRNLPTTHSPIDRQVFLHVLTENQRNAVRKLMISHDVNINVIASLELSRSVAVYTVYKTDNNGHRYVDDETGEVAVRTVRRKIKQRPTRRATMSDKPDCDVCDHFYISHEPECNTPIHGPDFELYRCGCKEYEPAVAAEENNDG